MSRRFITSNLSDFTVLLFLTILSRHQSDGLLTNCSYVNSTLCGDICLESQELCNCGGFTFKESRRYYQRNGGNYKIPILSYCCTPPSAKCTKTENGADCPDGEVYDIDSENPCYFRCYNDYYQSELLGFYTHFTCPGKCVRWVDLCQGVSFCEGDLEVCRDGARAPGNHPSRKYLVENDNAYDVLDRSDEIILQTVKSAAINYSALAICSYNAQGDQGVLCDGECLPGGEWCRERDPPRYCQDSGVYTADARLCSNHTLWRDISCNFTFSIPGFYKVFNHGERCSGTNQECYWPYPSDDSFARDAELTNTCKDLSDRVFELGKPCQKTPGNICYDSCDAPGQGCTSCSNHNYFNCSGSNFCIHPSLVCDGHPQCQNGEDEQMDICRTSYEEKNLISKYATFRCQSIMYPVVTTYATACDDFPECVDKEDETLCSDDAILNKVLLATVIFIAILYLTLRLGSFFFQFCKKDDEKFNLDLMKGKGLEDNILEKYSKDHDNDEIIERLNSFLLHIIFTKKTDETIVMCRELYSIESKIHENDKAEIFCCLHKNMDPLIMETVVNSQFKGLTKKCTDKLESCCKRRWITKSYDYSIAHEWMSVIINTTVRLVKIEFQYLDILKDFFLACSLFLIVGGTKAIIEFPTNFSIVVVLCLLSSVIGPVFFATLHLVVHNPFLIFPKATHKNRAIWKKVLMISICCLLSIFNPIFLVNAYESAKEKTRVMARDMDRKVILQMRHARAIKDQWVSFIQIELGLEVFYQAAGQTILLLYTLSETRTTGGLETVFKQNTFMGFPMDPIVILGISIALTLKSCFSLHYKAIKTEKHFVPATSKFFIILWGLFSSTRRIISVVCFFVPSMGLFNILYHHRAEQLPFTVWKRYNKTQEDKIALFDLQKTYLWGDIDRWDYSTQTKGTPPHYSEYSGLSLQQTFCLFFGLTAAQFIATFIVKICTSTEFLKKRNVLNKFLHVSLSLNLGYPYKDWDYEKLSVLEYKERHKQTNIEMAWSLSINILFSLVMMVPLWYTGHKIQERHLFLQQLKGTKFLEDKSFENINTCNIVFTILLALCSLLEILAFFLYNNKFHPRKEIVEHPGAEEKKFDDQANTEDQMDLEKVLEVEKRPSGGEHAVEQEQDTESSENNSEIKIKTVQKDLELEDQEKGIEEATNQKANNKNDHKVQREVEGEADYKGRGEEKEHISGKAEEQEDSMENTMKCQAHSSTQ